MPNDAANPQHFLLDQLQQQQPSSLLLVSPDYPLALAKWAEANHCHIDHINISEDPAKPLPTAKRYDFAIVRHTLEQLPKSAGETLIGTLRNLCSPRLLVMYQRPNVDGGDAWQANDFFALGLKQQGLFEHPEEDQPPLICFGYDLASYQFKRSWNSPQYWANPENWGKYWW